MMYRELSLWWRIAMAQQSFALPLLGHVSPAHQGMMYREVSCGGELRRLSRASPYRCWVMFPRRMRE
jgi:hypothetical protein